MGGEAEAARLGRPRFLVDGAVVAVDLEGRPRFLADGVAVADVRARWGGAEVRVEVVVAEVVAEMVV